MSVYLPAPTIPDIIEAARAVEGFAAVWLAETDAPPLDALAKALEEAGVMAFGALFPGVIFGGEAHEQGAVIFSVGTSAPTIISGLGAGAPVIPHPPNQAQTALVLVDGLAANVGAFLAELYKVVGSECHYFGGGAGSLSLQPAPCLFSRGEAHQDAALVVYLSDRCRLGVRHGWTELAGPMLSTHTDRNRVLALNWEPALQVYRAVVERDSGVPIDTDDFFSAAKGYPLGLLRTSTEPVIRDPISIDASGALVCVGEVPEHAAISIFKGDPDSLIAAAATAAGDCFAGEGPPRLAVLIDCISRSIYLEDRFPEELSRINEQLDAVGATEPLIGALTLGEVASVGAAFLEFFNKTCVVASLYSSE